MCLRLVEYKLHANSAFYGLGVLESWSLGVLESWGLGGFGFPGLWMFTLTPRKPAPWGGPLVLSSVSKLAQVVLRSSPNLTTAVGVKA